MLRYYPDKDVAIYSIGALHAIALLPALLLSRQYSVPSILLLLASVLYPIWGLTCLFVALFAPFVHSILWGIALCIALRRPIAIAYMSGVGILTSIGIYFIIEHDINVTGASNDYALSGMITIWHTLMLFTLPLIVWHKPRPWPDVYFDRRICRHCGYSLAGLDPTAVCPECGSPRAIPSHTHGA